jgi:iron complex outermembrane receptor protein
MRTTSWRRLTAIRILGAAGMATISTAVHAQTPVNYANLSIEELGEIQVTSVSKRAEPVREAPSAIYVITHDDIVRSGARTIPEILRLAPNLYVAQTAASEYVVTARGFSGNAEAQSFSNKLLVLIDGRSIYTPLYSGVYWNMQDVLPADIERIEVISGPGATLWGANAVNGVINITTRKSSDTQGGLLEASADDRERAVGLRYGGRLGDDLTYRLYARSVRTDSTETRAGVSRADDASREQGGFRLDWTPTASDVLTFQGDAYDGSVDKLNTLGDDIEGQNLLARWTRSAPNGSKLQVQAYYDRTQRASKSSRGEGFTFDTYDIDIQHSFDLGARHALVWGGGFRRNHYEIIGAPTFYFVPLSRDLNLTNLFVQDSISITDKTRLIVGLKVEDGPYLDPEILPSARLSWAPNDTAMVWAAASRAVRSPTPFDRDVVEIFGGAPFLAGNANFQSEKLTAYEVGTRITATSNVSFSVSAYYNVYDDLRSIEFDPVTTLPLRWGNRMEGHTQGVEAWGEYRAASWWRLTGGYAWLDKHLTFEPGSSAVLGLKQAGDDPEHQASIRSSMDLRGGVTLDAALRYVSVLPDPRVPSYVDFDARIAWSITDRAQLSISGRNLLHDRRPEFPDGPAISRSVSAGLQWRF